MENKKLSAATPPPVPPLVLTSPGIKVGELLELVDNFRFEGTPPDAIDAKDLGSILRSAKDEAVGLLKRKKKDDDEYFLSSTGKDLLVFLKLLYSGLKTRGVTNFDKFLDNNSGKLGLKQRQKDEILNYKQGKIGPTLREVFDHVFKSRDLPTTELMGMDGKRYEPDDVVTKSIYEYIINNLKVGYTRDPKKIVEYFLELYNSLTSPEDLKKMIGIENRVVKNASEVLQLDSIENKYRIKIKAPQKTLSDMGVKIDTDMILGRIQKSIREELKDSMDGLEINIVMAKSGGGLNNNMSPEEILNKVVENLVDDGSVDEPVSLVKETVDDLNREFGTNIKLKKLTKKVDKIKKSVPTVGDIVKIYNDLNVESVVTDAGTSETPIGDPRVIKIIDPKFFNNKSRRRSDIDEIIKVIHNKHIINGKRGVINTAVNYPKIMESFRKSILDKYGYDIPKFVPAPETINEDTVLDSIKNELEKIVGKGIKGKDGKPLGDEEKTELELKFEKSFRGAANSKLPYPKNINLYLYGIVRETVKIGADYEFLKGFIRAINTKYGVGFGLKQVVEEKLAGDGDTGKGKGDKDKEKVSGPKTITKEKLVELLKSESESLLLNDELDDYDDDNELTPDIVFKILGGYPKTTENNEKVKKVTEKLDTMGIKNVGKGSSGEETPGNQEILLDGFNSLIGTLITFDVYCIVMWMSKYVTSMVASRSKLSLTIKARVKEVNDFLKVEEVTKLRLDPNNSILFPGKITNVSKSTFREILYLKLKVIRLRTKIMKLIPKSRNTLRAYVLHVKKFEEHINAYVKDDAANKITMDLTKIENVVYNLDGLFDDILKPLLRGILDPNTIRVSMGLDFDELAQGILDKRKEDKKERAEAEAKRKEEEEKEKAAKSPSPATPSPSPSPASASPAPPPPAPPSPAPSPAP